MKYYKIDTKEIINTAKTIPEELLSKKGLLPYFVEVKRYPEGTTPDEEEGVKVLSNKVVKVVNKFYHVNTLEEEKALKIKNLKKYVEPKFPELWRQINAILGEYDADKNQEIKDKVSELRAYIDAHETAINALDSVDDVKSYDYLMEEDKVEE
jgi:hypothetical protein